jgi:hypothetical protein
MTIKPEIESAANIGFGTGLTSSTIILSPRIKRLDNIEIEREVMNASRLMYPRVIRALEDSRNFVHIDDAKSFFSSFSQEYDLIISEPSNPWVSGVSGLFTREFYRLIPRYLKRNGLFTQWLHLYNMNPELVSSIMRALGESFKDYSVYITNSGDIIVVASASGPVGRPSQDAFAWPGFTHMLRRVNVNSVLDLEIRWLGNKRILAPYFESFKAPVNSDYYPYLDLMSVKARFMGQNAMGLFSYIESAFPVAEMLSGGPVTNSRVGVSPVGSFKKNDLILQAAMLKEYLLVGREPFGFDFLPQDERTAARALRGFMHDCDAGYGPDLRKSAIFHTLKAVTGHLGADESRQVFEKLGAWQCYKSLSSSERRWVELFIAIGARDAAGMKESALALLENEGDMPAAAWNHLVAAGMLGAVVTGDVTAAVGIYEEHKDSLDNTGPYGSLFALLIASSGAGSTEGFSTNHK